VTAAPATVLTVTCNPCIDLGFSVERVVSDAKLRVADIRHDPGGGGVNASRVIKRLGGETVAWGLAGGEAGKMLERLLDEEGVVHRFIPIAGDTRINTTVFERATGAEYLFSMPGPEVTADELDLLLTITRAIERKFALAVFSGSLPPGVPQDTHARLVQSAHRFRIRSIVDASGEALRESVRAKPFLVKPNRDELAYLAGRPLESTDDLLKAARELTAAGCGIVVVSQGADGALAVTSEEAVHAPAPQLPAKSRVGAGDSLVGALALKLAQGAPLAEALAFGVAAGTAAALTPGTELCLPEDVAAILPLVRVEKL